METDLACNRSNLGNYTMEISDTGEKAFQRAIIDNRVTSTELGTIEWLDIELPIDSERKARGHSIDLLGKRGDKFIICELKFSETGDSPLEASKQVKEYYKLIQQNYKDLDKNDNIHHKNGKYFQWKDFAGENVVCMVVANEDYWKYWLEHRKMKLPQDIECYLVYEKSDEFKKQKGDKSTYTPKLVNNSWKKL